MEDSMKARSIPDFPPDNIANKKKDLERVASARLISSSGHTHPVCMRRAFFAYHSVVAYAFTKNPYAILRLSSHFYIIATALLFELPLYPRLVVCNSSTGLIFLEVVT